MIFYPSILTLRDMVAEVARSHTGAMDYDEACIMHLTPGVVHNFPKTVGISECCPLCTKRSQIPI